MVFSCPCMVSQLFAENIGCEWHIKLFFGDCDDNCGKKAHHKRPPDSGFVRRKGPNIVGLWWLAMREQSN